MAKTKKFNKKLAIVEKSVDKPKSRNLGGRPPKLSKKLIHEMSNLLRMGAYVESAALAIGLSRETFYAHLKKGNKDIDAGSYLTLSAILVREIHKATEVAVMRDLKRIDEAADADWRAAAWKMERRQAAQWGSKSAVKLEKEKPGFSDSESLHSEMAKLIATHEEVDHGGDSTTSEGSVERDDEYIGGIG